MQTPTSARVICGLVLGWVGCSPGLVRADPSWADRLRTEALPAWDTEHANRVVIEGTSHVTIRGTTKTVGFVLRSKANYECALVAQTKVESGVTELFAYNPKYTFRLRMTGAEQWAVVSVHQGDPTADREAKVIRDNIDLISRLNDYALRIPYGADLFTTFVRKPTMRVASVTPVSWNGADVVEVKLEAAPSGGDEVFKSITRLHDPSRNWRTVRTVVSGHLKSHGRSFEGFADYEYAPGPDGLLTRVTERDSWKEKDGKLSPVETDRTFELKRLTTLPDTSEFTLTAFGLPEPIGVEWPKKRSPWLWFVAAGVGFVAVMAGLRWLSRRAARRTATPAA